ncbi:MAG: GspH/FimT family pseudopilin [Gammaproteobacteria bacterium]|nr:GspH/FimT family pseudopilin [Gammaproteobacteria bacterium]
MKKQQQRGFTLIELMTAIFVMAIVIGIGIPSMSDFVRNSRMTSTANNFLAAMHMARSAAVSRRAPTMVCRSANATAPAPSCDDAGTGWIAYVDGNDTDGDGMPDGNGALDAGEEILLASEGPPDTITIFTTPAGTSSVAYASTGFLRAGSATGFRLCDTRGNVLTSGAGSTARAIVISPTGRPQIQRTIDEVNNAGGCP